MSFLYVSKSLIKKSVPDHVTDWMVQPYQSPWEILQCEQDKGISDQGKGSLQKTGSCFLYENYDPDLLLFKHQAQLIKIIFKNWLVLFKGTNFKQKPAVGTVPVLYLSLIHISEPTD